jgi:hypothetical protein
VKIFKTSLQRAQIVPKQGKTTPNSPKTIQYPATGGGGVAEQSFKTKKKCRYVFRFRSRCFSNTVFVCVFVMPTFPFFNVFFVFVFVANM